MLFHVKTSKLFAFLCGVRKFKIWLKLLNSIEMFQGKVYWVIDFNLKTTIRLQYIIAPCNVIRFSCYQWVVHDKRAAQQILQYLLIWEGSIDINRNIYPVFFAQTACLSYFLGDNSCNNYRKMNIVPHNRIYISHCKSITHIVH